VAGTPDNDANKIVLAGKMSASSIINKAVPSAGKEVKLYRLAPETCINMPPKWIETDKTTTAADGSYTFEVNLQSINAITLFATAFTASDGKVLASSNTVEIDQTYKFKRPLFQTTIPQNPA